MANSILVTGMFEKPEQTASLWCRCCCRVWTCEEEFDRSHCQLIR